MRMEAEDILATRVFDDENDDTADIHGPDATGDENGSGADEPDKAEVE